MAPDRQGTPGNGYAVNIDRQPYTMTLTPGRNADACANRAARYVIDRWLPDNAGGIHLMVTSRLAGAFYLILTQAAEARLGQVRVRVEIRGSIPELSVLDSAPSCSGGEG